MERRPFARMDEQSAREGPEGIFRTTLSHDDALMLCHFFMRKGAKVPVHDHPAAQIGYVIKGKLRFRRGESESFTAFAGCSYVFDGGEPHGADVLEEAEVIECFSPMRPEYADGGTEGNGRPSRGEAAPETHDRG
jgi:quercetin dioxygenase-like cupin family protein